MTDKSSALPGTDKPVDLSPKNLMGKPIRPNYGMTHAAQSLKGANVQIHYDPNAGLRSKQNDAVRMFIEGQRTALYLQSRKGSISERDYRARAGDLNRIRDIMIRDLAGWAGTMNPREGAIGTNLSREFDAACRGAFYAVRDSLNSQIEVTDVPLGPVSGQEAETPKVEIPVNVKLSDLDIVEQPLNSGPLFEQSVLEGGLQQPELPIYVPEVEVEENSDAHPVRYDDIGSPEGGDDPIRDVE